MPGEEMSIGTLQAIKSMVEHPLKCQTIVQDDTLFGGLVVLLSNPSHMVILETLEILQKMADGTENRACMRSYIGLKEQMQELKNSDKADIKTRSEKIYETLWHPACPHPPGPPRDTTNQQRQTLNVPKQGQKVNRRNSMQVRGGLNRAGKTVVLQIRGMHDKEDMEVCRAMVLNVKGVISITFNMQAKRAVLRARNDLKPELLGQAIARTCTMSAQLVTKDDDGNEVFHKLATPVQAEKENIQLPDYPEDDSPIKGYSNMARPGAVPADGNQNGWSFVKTVGNFLSNSFYW